jgi:protein-S-isoprenylcysteine O-methyltransferase Ste14
VVPALILASEDAAEPSSGLGLLGLLPIAAGFGLWVWTVRLLARIGRGTLAPWDPTRRLVVEGPYRHVRNPMITGVLAVLLGEAALFESAGVLIWTAAFFAINCAYFVLVEEPGLERRFGDEYRDYSRAVPRWIPRLSPLPRDR